MSEPPPREGRAVRARGRERREQLVEAAARAALADGIAALSHRAVAAAAGVPLGSTTYYFATLGELRAAAVERILVGDRERRAEILAEPLPPQAPAADLAWRLLDVVIGHGRLDEPAQVALLYERLAEAAHTPELAPVVRQAAAEVEADAGRAAAGTGWAQADPGTLVAVVDGRAIAWLAFGETDQALLVERIAADLRPHAAP